MELCMKHYKTTSSQCGRSTNYAICELCKNCKVWGEKFIFHTCRCFKKQYNFIIILIIHLTLYGVHARYDFLQPVLRQLYTGVGARFGCAALEGIYKVCNYQYNYHTDFSSVSAYYFLSDFMLRGRRHAPTTVNSSR